MSLFMGSLLSNAVARGGLKCVQSDVMAVRVRLGIPAATQLLPTPALSPGARCGVTGTLSMPSPLPRSLGAV